MATAGLALFAALWCLKVSYADINVSDYIYWKKQDISKWHQFFPIRGLNQEQTVLIAALTAVGDLESSLNDSLSRVIAFQAQELQTAQLLMDGTPAEGCINGISNYLTNVIDDELTLYLDCAADAQAKLLRLNTTLAKTKKNYLVAYQRALNGIDVCAKTYPNKDSISRLMSCVESMNQNYFTAANATLNAVYPSPSMTYFQQNVVTCASNAANNVADAGWKFLGMLEECAKLSGTVDPTSYAEELNKWKGYNDTLGKQITDSQNKSHAQVLGVEEEMLNYYNLQKQALEQYVIQSRGLTYYQQAGYLIMSDYYNTITATSLDNPGDATCTTDAKTTLDSVVNQGATEAVTCDIANVNNTKTLIQNVTNIFLELNTLLPSIGNAAILQCFSEGYIFAPNTIADCFDLVYSQFDVDHADRKTKIIDDVNTVTKYVSAFFSVSNLPCGGTSLRRLLWGGDKTLYQLQRCLYINSGTTYSVTTPIPYTTTYVTETTPMTTTTTPAAIGSSR